MEGFWEKFGGKVEQHEPILVRLGIAGLAGCAIVLLYFFFINNERSELVFLLAVFSMLVVFLCAGLGMVKYTFLDQKRASKTIHPFMRLYATAFLSFWFIILSVFFIVVASKIVRILL